MKKKVSIVTSGHPYYDERIFYKFARSLTKHDYDVSIICSTGESEIDFVKDNIHIIGFDGSNLNKSKKVSKFEEYLKSTDPEVIICCEPLPILAAVRIRKNNKVKVIYDVTEWYPENVAFKFSSLKKITTYFQLFIFNIITANLSNAIIIGEKGKKKRYDFIAPFKPKKIISYFPVLEFFEYSEPILNDKGLVLCYAGLLKFDRGLTKLLDISKTIAHKHKEISITFKLIGKFESNSEEREFIQLTKEITNLRVEYCDWVEYPKISEQLSNSHICFDLREGNFVYNNSLPIKIFEYMACGKPFIFSDIKPIRNEIEFNKCGFLVNPNNINEIIMKIEKYLDNKELLRKHSINGRALVETKYNWEKESTKLMHFISSLD